MTSCKNCGAPITNYKCEYCGADYLKSDIADMLSHNSECVVEYRHIFRDIQRDRKGRIQRPNITTKKRITITEL